MFVQITSTQCNIIVLGDKIDNGGNNNNFIKVFIDENINIIMSVIKLLWYMCYIYP